MKPLHPVSLWLALALVLSARAGVAATNAPTDPAETFPVTIRVDASKSLGPLKPLWRFFGADEPNFATMKDGRKLIGELGALAPGRVYFRAHNLLSTGDGTPALKWGSTNAYTEDAAGNAIYNWAVIDRIFDTYLARHVRPYVEIGFMPEALSVKPEPYQHDWRPGGSGDLASGWAYPPKDYAKWGELVFQWVKHCVERYGRAEVEQWYWEVWNEANYPAYWHGSANEFYKMHDYAIAAVRRALPTARVGGPDSAGPGGAFTTGFIEHCLRGTNYATGEKGTPFDFISFHAKGSPTFVENRFVRMGISNQLRDFDTGFALIAAYPELKRMPIIIGESDPDGCAACTAAVYPQNNYRNSSLYASYTAATFGRAQALADRHGVNLEGVLTWAFEFEDQPFFAGFRVLATNGIDLPVLNTFRMFNRMGGARVAVTSTHEVPFDDIIKTGVRTSPDVSALAGLEKNRLSVFVWHYHDDNLPGPSAEIALDVGGLPAAVHAVRLTHYRIDDEHSNSFTAWQKMGSPAGPNREQYQQLLAAGQLAQLGAPTMVAITNSAATLKFTLPRQAVSLLVLEWE